MTELPPSSNPDAGPDPWIHFGRHYFSLLTNYTYSKCLDVVGARGDIAATSVSQPFNPPRRLRPCASDYRHIFNPGRPEGE